MARILLVDPSETARLAMQGILARGTHRFAAVDAPADAWRFLQLNPGTDLLFTGLQLEGAGNGLALIYKLRADPWLKHLPIVVYTGHRNRASVKAAINLRVQNFLVKPYHDDEIFAEIDKAIADPWRDRFFEKEESFCRQMQFTPQRLHSLLAGLTRELANASEALRRAGETNDPVLAADTLTPLARQAEEAGARAVMEAVVRLAGNAERGEWWAWHSALDALDFSGRLLACRLDSEHAASPGYEPEPATNPDPLQAQQAAWLAAPLEGRCPVVATADLMRAAGALRGCPVIASAAAGFSMMATGHPSCINPIMDLVARDPGLTAEMLIAANRTRPAGPGDNPIEDARLAVGQLGEIRLASQARNLLVLEERVLQLPPDFDWPRYWTFLRSVARIAQVISRELDFASLEPVARTAGQLHDIGRLLLAHLQPAGFQAVHLHARTQQVRLHQAEKLFLGCTTNELGAHFAGRIGLPPRFVNVIRGIDDPGGAREDKILVAIISLARKLCRQNLVGASGDPPLKSARPIKSTAQWAILSEGIYAGFDLARFELQIHAQCKRLRAEFSGHQTGTVGELLSSTAEL